MKVKNLFIMSLAAFSLVACSNDEETAVPQEGSVVVNLTTADPKTKADPLTTGGYKEENAMSTGKVYAFLNGTTLVETKEFSTASNEVKFDKLTVGSAYQFVAVANSATTTATTADGFKTLEIAAPTAKEDFVMYNVASVSDLKATNEINMTVKRVLSAVQLGTVTRAQTEAVPSAYRNATMTINSLTLYNVNPSVNLDGTKKDGKAVNATDLAALFTDKTVANSASVDIKGTDVAARAYACPTTGSATLYGVLEVTYSDGIGRKYYNISLPAGLDANTLYLLHVTIVGVGSNNPGDPDEFGGATGKITPAPWSNGSVINVENQEG